MMHWFGLRMADGTLAWTYRSEDHAVTRCGLRLVDEKYVVCGTHRSDPDSSTWLWALDVSACRVVGTIEVPESAGLSDVDTEGERVYAAILDRESTQSRVVAWTPGERALEWQRFLPGLVSSGDADPADIQTATLDAYPHVLAVNSAKLDHSYEIDPASGEILVEHRKNTIEVTTAGDIIVEKSDDEPADFLITHAGEELVIVKPGSLLAETRRLAIDRSSTDMQTIAVDTRGAHPQTRLYSRATSLSGPASEICPAHRWPSVIMSYCCKAGRSSRSICAPVSSYGKAMTSSPDSCSAVANHLISVRDDEITVWKLPHDNHPPCNHTPERNLDMQPHIRRCGLVTVAVLAATLALTSCTGPGNDPGDTPASAPSGDPSASWPDAPDLRTYALSGLDATPQKVWNVAATAIDSGSSELWPEAASEEILAVSVQAATAADADEPTTTRADLTQIVGLKLSDGSVAWRHDLAPDTKTDCSERTLQGALVCTTRGGDAGTIWALELSTGKPVSSIDVPGLASSLAVAESRNRVFVPLCDPATGKPGVAAWDVAKQSLAWKASVDGETCDSGVNPQVDAAGKLVLLDLNGKNAYAFDAESGAAMPAFSGTTTVTPTGDLLSGETVYSPVTAKAIVKGAEGSLTRNSSFAIDKSSHKMQILEVADNKLRLHDRSDGGTLWEAPYSDDAMLEAVCDKTMVFFGPNLGDYAINMATGERTWAREEVHIGFDGGFCGDQSVILINPTDDGLTSISTADGSTNWILDGPTADPDAVSSWWALDGHLILTADGAISLWR